MESHLENLIRLQTWQDERDVELVQRVIPCPKTSFWGERNVVYS